MMWAALFVKQNVNQKTHQVVKQKTSYGRKGFRASHVLHRFVFGLSLVFLLLGCQHGAILGIGAKSKAPVLMGHHEAGVAPAIVFVPDTLEVMTVDGEPVPMFLRGSKLALAVPPGKRVLAVRYVDIWEFSGDNHEVVRSDEVRIRSEFRSGGRYRLKKPPYFKEPDAARVYAATFEPVLLRDRQVVSVGVVPGTAESVRIDAQNAAAQGVVPVTVEDSNFLDVPRVENEKVLVSPESLQTVITPERVKTGSVAPVEAVSPMIESMKVLWQQLTEAERSAFKLWLVEQNRTDHLNGGHE